MKSGSKFLKLVLVGVLGAAVMIGCSDDNISAPESENAVETVAPEDSTSTTVKASTTTVEETTTTTTVPQTTTTVKANKPISTTTRPPSTPAPTLAATTTVPPTTQAPTTVPTTQAPTTAPPVTLPPVNVTAEWSGSNTGCPSLYPGSITLDVVVTGGTSPRVTVSVQGSSVSQPGPSYVNGVEESFWFDGFPSSLPDGSYTVNISVSDSGHATTNLSKTVVYACV